MRIKTYLIAAWVLEHFVKVASSESHLAVGKILIDKNDLYLKNSW